MVTRGCDEGVVADRVAGRYVEAERRLVEGRVACSLVEVDVDDDDEAVDILDADRGCFGEDGVVVMWRDVLRISIHSSSSSSSSGIDCERLLLLCVYI